LEAAAPARGVFAPLARAWIRHAIPLAGRLSPDPTAYQYLSDSIFEFGSGGEVESAHPAAGRERRDSREFLFGSTRLGGAVRRPAADQIPAGGAVSGRNAWAVPASATARRQSEVAVSRLLQSIVSLALAGALLWALQTWVKVREHLPLTPPQRFGGWVLLVGGFVLFTIRGVAQAMRWSVVRGGRGPRG